MNYMALSQKEGNKARKRKEEAIVWKCSLFYFQTGKIERFKDFENEEDRKMEDLML